MKQTKNQSFLFVTLIGLFIIVFLNDPSDRLLAQFVAVAILIYNSLRFSPLRLTSKPNTKTYKLSKKETVFNNTYWIVLIGFTLTTFFPFSQPLQGFFAAILLIIIATEQFLAFKNKEL